MTLKSQPHIYEAAKGLKLCRHCYKNAEHEIHSVEPNFTALKLNDRQLEVAQTFPEIALEAIVKNDSADQAINEDLTTWRIEAKCPGHPCPQCKKTWKHDYRCEKAPTVQALCQDCASQDAAIVNRPKSLETLVQQSRSPLTGQEVATIMLEHEEFVVRRVIHKEDGTVREDWQDRLVNHINAKRRLIEELRAQISASTRAKAKQECEDLTKLSPEEIEQYKRDAAKMKRRNEPKVAKLKDEKEKARKKALKGLCDMILMTNPKLSREKALEIAEKSYKPVEENNG